MAARLTVMVAVPAPTALILPFSTTAIFALLEIYASSPAFSGVRDAPAATSSRTLRSKLLLATIISVGSLLTLN